MEEFLEVLQFEFIQHAIGAGILTAIVCGMIGALVVVNRIVFIAGGVAHAAYGGIGISFYFTLPVFATTMVFVAVSTSIMALVTRHKKHRSDSVIGVMWAAGMALGIIFIDLTPGYHTELFSYLFGSILTVTSTDLYTMFGLDVLILGLVCFFYQELLALSYDEEFAKARGIPVDWLYWLQTMMIAATVVIVIQVVGLILVIALLTIAPLIVEKYTRSLKGLMIGSVVLNLFFTCGGLWGSYHFEVTSGASIISVAVVTYIVVWSYHQFDRFIFKRLSKSETEKSKEALVRSQR